MARAKIQINGADATAANVAISSTVLLSNDDEGGELTYAWSITDQPEGTADVLSNAAIENPSFTPTKEGTYQIRLVVNALSGTEAIQTAAVSVLDTRTKERIPAAGETLETGSVKGWALALNRISARTLHASVDGNLQIAMTPGGISPGTMVKLSGISQVNVGTQAQFEAMTITQALGTVLVSGRVGFLVDGVTPGDVGAGKLVIVRMFGISPVAPAGSPAVGDPVYLGNTGSPSLTPGTTPRVIGVVLSASGGTYRWRIDGQDALTINVPGRRLNRQRFAANTTYVPTPGTLEVILRMAAGGGGGGGVLTNGGAAGGNSGFYAEHRVVNPAGITGGAVIIGAGGAGGAAGNNPGATGGDTSFVINGVTFIVKGGTGGRAANNTTTIPSGPLAPQAGSTATDILFYRPGGTGQAGTVSGVGGGGGSTPLGGGAAPAVVQNTSSVAGNAGSIGGGGGGGGASGNTATSVAGGGGGGGLGFIDEYA
jgi:hypothetical protein